MVEVRDVCHAFDGRPVLRNVSTRFEEGKITVVMGSSGGGKTTLLKCISGLLIPDSGDVIIDEVDVRKEPDRVHGLVGLVFQYAALFDSLTVHDNILFGVRRQRRLSAKEGSELVGKMLAGVGLGDVAHMLPNELSGGMRKRVGLARALVMQPRILLYDEPTSGLDPVTAYSIDRLIVDTRDQFGVTSVVVSHDVSSILRVADRIVFLHQGRVLFDGTNAEFRALPADEIRDLVEKARSERFFDETPA